MHKCNHCRKEFEWQKESVWFGSYNDVDNWEGEESPIVKACTDSCAQHLWGEDYELNIEPEECN